MDLNEEEKSKVEKLPLMLRMAVKYLLDALRCILNDECNEEAVGSVMATVVSNSSGRYSNCDLVNYEQAARILGVSETNRAKTKFLLDKNGIKQVVLHNQKVGFVRAEVVALADKLYSKNCQRKRKRENNLQIK